MRARVNELLEYARVPFHFWTEVRGGTWPWDNPGCSLLSLCTFNLNQVTINVPAEMEAAVEECRMFSTDHVAISAILEWVNERSSGLFSKASALQNSGVVVQELTTVMNNLQTLHGMVSLAFGGVTQPKALDPSSAETALLFQCLISLKSDMDDLEAAITRAAPSKA